MNPTRELGYSSEMAKEDAEYLRVGTVEAAQRELTLNLLLSHVEHHQRTAQIAASLEAERTGKLTMDGMLEARRDQQLVGTAWCYSQAGKTAVVFPAQLIEGEPESTAVALHQTMGEYLTAHRVRLAQGLLDTDSSVLANRLRSDGFRRVTDMLYLVSEVSKFPNLQPPSQLDFTIYKLGDRGKMGGLVESTYSGTLDCPALNGIRDINDVLAGYESTGQFNPANWYFVSQGDKFIGCLLLTDHPAEDQGELVYMGLIPSARGRGWGYQITRFAQWSIRRAGRNRLVLAVDAENGPAINAYSTAGFSAWDRRSVFLKLFE